MRGWLGLVVTLVAACGPTLLWSGHTPDRAHAISIVRTDGSTQWILVDGKRMAAWRMIAAWSVAIGPDGRLVYAAQRAKHGWHVLDGGRKSEVWDGIGELVVEGARTAYSAERRGKWHVVVDRIAGPPFAAILARTLRFSPTGKRVAYVAQDAAGTHVVVDGVVGPAWTGVGQLKFSADGAHVAYAARQGTQAYVVVDGVVQAPYAAIAKLAFVGADVVYAAQAADGWHVVHGTQVSPAVAAVRALVVDGDRFAYLVNDGTSDRIGCDVTASVPATKVVDDSLALVGTTGCDTIHAEQDQTMRVVHGATTIAYADVGTLVPMAGGFGYAARTTDRWRIVIERLDGTHVERHGGDGSWVGAPVFASTGRLGFTAARGRKTALVVDDREYVFDTVMDDTLAFSRDGKHWAAIAGDVTKEQLFFVVDGTQRVPLAIHELYSAAASLDGQGYLAVDLDRGAILRTWSAAEAEKAATAAAAAGTRTGTQTSTGAPSPATAPR